MKQPWPPAEATKRINNLAKNDDLYIYWNEHALERLEERDLLSGDILHVLRNGFVYKEAEQSTREGFFKYHIETSAPNSGGRKVGVVVIPDEQEIRLKIVTVMWVDFKKG